jgi:hypothetical protein
MFFVTSSSQLKESLQEEFAKLYAFQWAAFRRSQGDLCSDCEKELFLSRTGKSGILPERSSSFRVPGGCHGRNESVFRYGSSYRRVQEFVMAVCQ